jgi:two-component system response regulator LytT
MTHDPSLLRALVVDDEAPARSELRYLLDEAGGVEVVGEAASAAEALQLIGALHYDVVFLDIEMPGMSGVQLAEALASRKRPPAVIFVTAYSTHAVKAFEVAATDYLVKPVQVKRLRQALERLQAAPAERPAPTRAPQAPARPADTVPVHKGEQTLLVPAREILYAVADDNYSRLCTRDECLLCDLSLLDLQKRLAARGFLRVHRRYLVNLARVTKVTAQDGDSLLLTLDDQDARCVPVSRRRANQVKRVLGL